METSQRKYLRKYGNFTHILNIELDDSLSENEKTEILLHLYEVINEKDIEKEINIGRYVSVNWRVYDETQLFRYYTNSIYIGDKGIYAHTQQLLTDIQASIPNADKFTMCLTKPLAYSIVLLP